MKIIILEGSPNKHGSSDMLADEFIRGAKEAGHEIMGLGLAQEKTISQRISPGKSLRYLYLSASEFLQKNTDCLDKCYACCQLSIFLEGYPSICSGCCHRQWYLQELLHNGQPFCPYSLLFPVPRVAFRELRFAAIK